MGEGTAGTTKEFPGTKQACCKACGDIQEGFIVTGLWKSIPQHHGDVLAGMATGERGCTHRAYTYPSELRRGPVAGRIANRVTEGCLLVDKNPRSTAEAGLGVDCSQFSRKPHKPGRFLQGLTGPSPFLFIIYITPSVLQEAM